MAEIRDIRNVEVRDIRVPSWMTNQPRLPSAPPVTVQVGVPIIDIPGCVEAHLDNKKGTNDKLVAPYPVVGTPTVGTNNPEFPNIVKEPPSAWKSPYATCGTTCPSADGIVLGSLCNAPSDLVVIPSLVLPTIAPVE